MVYLIYRNLSIHWSVNENTLLQNIFVKVNKLREIVQDQKTLISVFA